MNWKLSQYGDSQSASLANGFIKITCYRKTGIRGVEDPKPYAYSINGMKGKTEFADTEECKAFAEKQAQERWRRAGKEANWTLAEGE